MKTFKQFLSEEGPIGDGDCFKVAGRAVIEDESLHISTRLCLWARSDGGQTV